jgi:uncharacterized Rmd1/YagE family protein
MLYQAKSRNIVSSQSTCHAVCLADSFRQEQLRRHFKSQKYAQCVLKADYLYVQQPNWGEAVIYLYGCVVLWGIEQKEANKLIRNLKSISIEPYQDQVDEVYNIEKGNETAIIDSNIILQDDDLDAKVAISYALAQAVKLKHYEDILTHTLPDLLTLPSDLAKKGRIRISKKNALKKTGEIFLVRAQINLHSDLLDTPEYFWERSEREEQVYNLVIHEMELGKRVRKLNHRLDIMQSTYDLLRTHIEHEDSILLERTITILIALEIVFTIIQYVWPLHTL